MPPPVLRRLSIFALVALLLPGFALSAEDLAAVPELRSRVTDTTGILSEDFVETLEELSAALEERKGSQIAVLMLDSTKPEAIEEYGIRVAEAWKIGRAGVDDGIIVIVAWRDRKVRIEVGYGLEGAVPDAAAKRIIEEEMIPMFRIDRYGMGIEAGVRALIERIDPEALPPPTIEERVDGFLSRNRGNLDENFLSFTFFVFAVSLLLAVWRINFLLGFLPPLIIVGIPAAVLAYFLHTEWIIMPGSFFVIYVVILLYLYSGRKYGFGSGGGSSGSYSSSYSSSSYSSSSSSSSYSSSSSSSSSWSGGGGSFGGGGASGSW